MSTQIDFSECKVYITKKDCTTCILEVKTYFTADLLEILEFYKKKENVARIEVQVKEKEINGIKKLFCFEL